MTGPELKDLREDLGTAIGRRLSVADMARICGLAPKNGADTWRKWEDGDGPSGPVSAICAILAYAIEATPIPRELRDAAMGLGEAFQGERYFREMIREEIRRRLI
jgi:hypothetical protein